MKTLLKIAGIIVLLLVLAYGYYFYKHSRPAPIAADCVQSLGVAETTVTFTTEKKFSPPCVMVSSGSKIKWVNSSGSPLSLGADPHPIHTGNRELTNNQFVLDVTNGQSQEVTLHKVGSFGYHNHLAPWEEGTVVVK